MSSSTRYWRLWVWRRNSSNSLRWMISVSMTSVKCVIFYPISFSLSSSKTRKLSHCVVCSLCEFYNRSLSFISEFSRLVISLSSNISIRSWTCCWLMRLFKSCSTSFTFHRVSLRHSLMRSSNKLKLSNIFSRLTVTLSYKLLN